MSGVATSASDSPMALLRGFEFQQSSQGGRPGLMHAGAHKHLDGFQIETPRLTASAENDAQQLVYFARDFLADSCRRFFSCGVSVSSTGRRAQMFSLTSIICPQSS